MRRFTKRPVLRTFNKYHDYIYPVALTVLAHGLTYFLFPWVAPAVFPFYFLAVMLSVYFGRGMSGLISASLGMILSQFLLPNNTGKPFDILPSLIFFVVAVITAALQLRRIRLEKEFEQYELRSRELADAHSDAIITIDENNEIDYVNESAARMFGYSKEQLLDMSLLQLIPYRFRDAHKQGMKRYLQTGKRKLDWKAMKLPGLKHDGTEFIMELSFGEIEHHGRRLFTAFMRDITDEEDFKRRLVDSEQRFRLVTESVKDHAIISLDKDGIVNTWNKGAESVYGYTTEEAIGKKITFLFPDSIPDKDKRLKEELEIALREGKFEAEEERVHKSGRIIFISLVITPLFDEKGGLKWYGKIDRDITERIQFVRQLEEKNRELMAVNRSKDEFLATLSHELRTPLVSILGYTNMLTSGKLSSEMGKRAIETIAKNAKLQVDLIEDLLDISRIIAGKINVVLEPLPVCEVISEVVEVFKPQALERGIKLSCDFPDKNLFIKADSRRLSQIAMNLISNALKFTKAGGKVKVSVIREGDKAKVIVEDTGIGITPEVLPNLFQRFKQADSTTTRRYGGLGLGLSIVKQLTDLHGGTVKAESGGEGKGSTFTVTFDLCAVVENYDVHTTDNPEIDIEEPDLQGSKMLIVDDDEDTRNMLCDFFTRYGAEVVTAESAAQAREKIKEMGEADVFIFDIGMPQEDGFSLVRSLRRSGINTPALALTAFVGKEYEEAALDAGFQAYVSKPASLTYLARKVFNLRNQKNQ